MKTLNRLVLKQAYQIRQTRTKAISIISKNSVDSLESFKKPEFILVQPIQYDKSLLDNSINNNTHSLSLQPAYHQLSKIVDSNEMAKA